MDTIVLFIASAVISLKKPFFSDFLKSALNCILSCVYDTEPQEGRGKTVAKENGTGELVRTECAPDLQSSSERGKPSLSRLLEVFLFFPAVKHEVLIPAGALLQRSEGDKQWIQ